MTEQRSTRFCENCREARPRKGFKKVGGYAGERRKEWWCAECVASRTTKLYYAVTCPKCKRSWHTPFGPDIETCPGCDYDKIVEKRKGDDAQ